jgi:hypothetical protein
LPVRQIFKFGLLNKKDNKKNLKIRLVFNRMVVTFFPPYYSYTKPLPASRSKKFRHMKQQGRILTLLITTMLLVGQGCDDNQNPMYDYGSIWKCHQESNWSYETTKNEIVGLWEWKYIKCCGETTKPFQNGTASKGLKIEFKSDGTGILIDKDAIGEFTWDIDLLVNENGLYEFRTTSIIPQLYGRLLLCDNVMMCNSSYIDGADNFFIKIKTGTN